MELYPGYLADHFNIHKLSENLCKWRRCICPGAHLGEAKATSRPPLQTPKAKTQPKGPGRPAGRGTPTPPYRRAGSPVHATRPRTDPPGSRFHPGSILHHSSPPVTGGHSSAWIPSCVSAFRRLFPLLSPPTDRSIVVSSPVQQHISSVAYFVSRPALLLVCGAQLGSLGEHIYLALRLPPACLAPSCSSVLYLVPTHIHPQFTCWATASNSCVLILLLLILILVVQRHRRRLPAEVHDLRGGGAVRAGAPQDGHVRARPAAAAPPAPAAAGAGHVEQRALQGGQRRPGHQRVQHHGARCQVRPRRARRRSTDGRTGDGRGRRSGNEQAPRQGLEKTCTEQRGSSEKPPKKEGLHPAARVEPDKAGAAGARAAARQAAAGRVREEQPWGEPAASSRRLGRPRVRGRGADDGPRRGGVRDRLRALGGRAKAAHGGAAERAAAGAGHAEHGAAGYGGGRTRPLRPPLPDQGRRRAVRRLLRHVGALAVPRRALLPLDRRLPALRGPQDLEPAAAADGGGAVGGGVRSAADVGAGGGRAVAGHAEAAADAGRVPHGPLRRPRRLHGRRRGEDQGPRRLRAAGGPSPAGDAAEHEQDPDDAAGGQGPARAGGLLPAPPRAQHAMGGPPARVRHKLNCTPYQWRNRKRSMAQKKLVRTYVVIHPSAGQRRTKRSISLGPREKR